MIFNFTILPTSIGPLYIILSGNIIYKTTFSQQVFTQCCDTMRAQKLSDSSTIKFLTPSTLSYDLSKQTQLAQKTLSTLLRIAPGTVHSYQWVAQQIGNPKAVRAVAHAIATNPFPYLIPCHRVIRSTGNIGEYMFGKEKKKALLVSEGIIFDKNFTVTTPFI